MVSQLALLYTAGLKTAPDGGKSLKFRARTDSLYLYVCVCVITHIRGDLAQGPDGVYSLYSVIGDNNRGLTAAEHYLHGGIRRILHSGAFKQTWKKHTKMQNQVRMWQLIILRGTRETEAERV